MLALWKKHGNQCNQEIYGWKGWHINGAKFASFRHLIVLMVEGKNANVVILEAPWVMLRGEWPLFFEVVTNIKLLIWFVTSFKKYMVKGKLGVMKSHNYHIMFQSILPIYMHYQMTSHPHTIVLQLCKIFKILSCKMYNLTRFIELKSVAVYSLCLLEKVFPPNFFDLMTHVIHLIDELELCGHVHTRWMYLIKHAMKDLKGYPHHG
jgi:hypothetical protein